MNSSFLNQTIIKKTSLIILISIILLGLVWIVIPYLISLDYDPCYQVKYVYNINYKGKVIRIYTEKIKKIEVTANNQIITVSGVAHPLWNYIKLGDSIIKPKGGNYCYIKRDNKYKRFQYEYLTSDCTDTLAAKLNSLSENR